jgi:biopolymer transport protein ExbD
MAGASRYDDAADDDGITDINVTPFVDVVLVLLVIFIVTAKLIVARGVDISPPKATTGGEVQSGLRISVDQRGGLFVNGVPFTDDAAAIGRLQELAARAPSPKVIISGDRAAAYAGVMRAIDLSQKAGITAIALENVKP